MNAVMLISGTARHCWKSRDKKVEFWVMQCPEVCGVSVSVTKIIRNGDILVPANRGPGNMAIKMEREKMVKKETQWC